jgi:peroxiredoxin
MAAEESSMPLFQARIWALLLLAGSFFSTSSSANAGLFSRADKQPKVQNFQLQDHLGKSHELYQQTNDRAIVLIFATTGCPIVQKSVPKIKALRDRFASQDIRFWMINSNTTDDMATIREEARDFQIDLPILLDREQSVARSLNATRTAEVVCIQPKSWKVFYRGAIDDQLGYGTEKPQALNTYLENALNNFLAGKKISPAKTDFKGCRIQFETSRDNSKN